MNDTNITRQTVFRRDIELFLNLSNPLPSNIPKERPGLRYSNPQIQDYVDQYKINICNDKYIVVRRELLQLAQDTAIWIRNVFINSNGVYVSSQDYFEQILDKWMFDPCGNTTGTETISFHGPKIIISKNQKNLKK